MPSPVPAWPAICLALIVFGVAALASPQFVGRVVRLDRHHGDKRPLVYAIQAGLVAVALGIVIRRRPINARYRKAFPSTKQFALAVAMVILSLCISLAALEGLARLFHLPFRAKWVASETPLARFDRELGWSYIPNQTVTQEFGSDHRKITMYFDDLGIRVAKAGDHADPSKPTALFVGDSIPFGHGVTYEDSFVGRLASRPDFPYQVVNLGVQAYGTDQSLLLLKKQFKKFNTKLVVFVFTTNQVERNEVYDRRILYPDGLFLGTKPLLAVRPDGSVYIAKNAVEYQDYTYSHLLAALEVLKQRWGPEPSIRLTRALIQDMKNFVESNGARFVAVDWYDDPTFPWGLDLDVIRIEANVPPEWSNWIIPGETHPDARANLYASQLIAKGLQKILAQDKVASTAAAR